MRCPTLFWSIHARNKPIGFHYAYNSIEKNTYSGQHAASVSHGNVGLQWTISRLQSKGIIVVFFHIYLSAVHSEQK